MSSIRRRAERRVAEFLLEIGFEEMPADWLPGLAKQFERQFTTLCQREQLEPENTRTAWTPRRLVIATTIPARQLNREERIYGPSVKVARDSSGQWTQAALGFARKMDCSPDVLQVGEKDGAADSYVFLARKIKGRGAAQLLPGIIAATLRGLSFPKRMNWDAWLDDGKGAFPFGRPIRWLVALLDGRVVPFAIYTGINGGRGPVLVKSGNTSRGHRSLPRRGGRRPFAVRSFADLQQKLAKRFVILAASDREAIIRKALAPLSARIRDDHDLVGAWRDLVEYPTVLTGAIPKEFRGLPTEVLETVLVHHQKYIPIMDEGRSVARFAAVVNTDGLNASEITRGMERVVVARLRDAAFFFAEDLKRPLEQRVDDLAGVVFHGRLGTYRDKVERMTKLIDAMGPEMGLLTKQDHESARVAARLAKADLTTLMVREFPELQGVMGGIYLRAQGSSRLDVAQAIQWHYHPLSIETDALPAGKLHGGETTLFAVVSIADKLDTLAGYFSLGMAPSGSSDPFGLRRAAQGVLRVLVDFWRAEAGERRPSVRELVAASVRNFSSLDQEARDEVAGKLENFLFDRLRYLLVARGYPGDEVEAALGAREPDALDDPYECLARLSALHHARAAASDDFTHLATAFKRARNILEGAEVSAPDPSLFENDAERDLYDVVSRLARGEGGYEARLKSLAGLRGPVDRFFDDVLVMDENPEVRANRLSLLARTLSLFYRVADISNLSIARPTGAEMQQGGKG
jgi:glycyl-tRNA synthetase beta chain